MLVHYNLSCILWIDLDTLKEFGFGAVTFHTITKEEPIKGTWPFKSSIQTILFLSRLLTQAGQNYWSNELEIAGFG